MYYDTILKVNHLKQAHTNTVTVFSRKNNTVRFDLFGRIFRSKLLSNQKSVSWSKFQKSIQKMTFRKLLSTDEMSV